MGLPTGHHAPARANRGDADRTSSTSARRRSAPWGQKRLKRDESLSNDVGRSRPRGKETARKTAKRSFKAQGLSRLIPKVLKDGVGRKGSLEADLAIHWREVVGEDLANWTLPGKITYSDRKMRRKGTLLVLVNPGYAQFAQMLQSDILSSVNQFLGFGRVEKIQLKQSHAIGGGAHRTTVSSRGVAQPPSRLEPRRERRQSGTISASLEALRQSVAEREKRR